MQLIPATGGSLTITASTVEGAFYQMIGFLQDAESQSNINGSGVNRTIGKIDEDTSLLRGSFNFDARTITENGESKIETSDYLTIPSWSAGDESGTLKGQTWSQQFLEIITLFIEKQNDAVANPDEILWIDCSHDFVTGRIAGDINNLPLERVQTTEGWAYKAREIL